MKGNCRLYTVIHCMKDNSGMNGIIRNQTRNGKIRRFMKQKNTGRKIKKNTMTTKQYVKSAGHDLLHITMQGNEQ